MTADASGGFLAYHEPDIISILTLISFFLFLAIAEWLADKIVRASLIGHIIVGLIYGVPIANILGLDWQATFLALGYIGLILIIFEGGLTIRLDLLRQNLLLSVVAALLGVLTPIALSFALLYAGFHHSPLETFIVGTALCSTSLGTTFVVLASASKNKPTTPKPGLPDSAHAPATTTPAVDFSQTRIGTVLVSAAVLDDVCGLVLVSVIHNLRGIASGDGGTGLGWIIGRPVLASALMALLTPAVARFVAGPLYRRFVAPRLLRFEGGAGGGGGGGGGGVGHVFNILLMAVVLCGFLAIAAYAGASMLFGAFLAGAFVSGLLGSKGMDMGEEQGFPAFADSFEHYLGAPQKYVFQPLFFASIGFAIPFIDLWTGEVIWKGFVYTLLMVFAKLIVGIVVPVWDFISPRIKKRSSEKTTGNATASWAPATLLGACMVARGEIGLLIIQIGLNETPFLTQKAFIIGVWAIVLNTIIGPVLVGILLKRAGASIARDARWGVQAKHGSDTETNADVEPPGTSGGTSPRLGLA
ncbi:Sodium/hydrogen exchanger family-domain-containing protein [Chaetomium sp. MPI-CAGE-AT-0009]|nr:Sodium/hydrogen exchanger family-domain-containing protein [Chaetomium sp. MPI-CAGE-AT-0009]